MRLLGILVLLVALPAACHDDNVGSNGDLVGGRCTIDTDCRKRCLQGGEFPGGYCSLTCQADADCPSGSVCIDKSGGVCLLGCLQPTDCAGLGVGYKCEAKERKSIKGAKIAVCIGD